MPELIEQQIQHLGAELQAYPIEASFAGLPQTYQALRQAFAHLLFHVNHYPQQQYAWLLMNQDATGALVTLSRLYADWQQSSPKAIARAKYGQALEDFQWLMATALLCVG